MANYSQFIYKLPNKQIYFLDYYCKDQYRTATGNKFVFHANVIVTMIDCKDIINIFNTLHNLISYIKLCKSYY